ncbi:DUF4085 family protein [Neobacillus niacini]|uniref:DUF4085 family protein n=1 Tax=Neobacillus niacini TaxID=86668 RepID=UPI0007ABA880|nr:DUF4085 family protein [Neobacillus niacini]MEC1523796.1 DUF4085 family protein [Neobacillus niacini]
MWNLTKEAKEKFSKCHLLPIHESDDDWKMAITEAKAEGEDLIARLNEELEEVKEELLLVLPSRFIPYVEDGTLNQPTLPKNVRENYLQWMQDSAKEFEQTLDAAYEQTQQAVAYLPMAVQDVFAESLHDAIIERIEREGNTLHLYINTDSGFSTKFHIHLIFKDVIIEESDDLLQLGQWLIYYELQKTDAGFAFRVLFDCPEAEWTITMKGMDAQYYYRPMVYTRLRDEEKLEETSLAEYVSLLNPDYRYWLITPHLKSSINTFTDNLILNKGNFKLGQNEMVVSVENQRFIYDLTEYNPIQFIYTDVYEYPYAHFNEPVPTEQIEAAALGNDLELQVRAWNTMYANPKALADIINRVLWKIQITEENEMMVSVYASHFYKSEILIEAVLERYRNLID